MGNEQQRKIQQLQNNQIAEAKVHLVLEGGAEQTKASVTDDANIPSVEGLGSVEVTNTETSNVEIVAADNNGAESEIKVTIHGNIESWEGDPLEGVTVYLSGITVNRSIDTDGILEYCTGDDAETAETSAEGTYSFAEISLGNYYLTAVREGMETIVQTVTIGTNNVGTDNVYTVGKTVTIFRVVRMNWIA